MLRGRYGDHISWGYFWARAPNVAHAATGGKKWLKKPKSERKEIFTPLDSSRWADHFRVVERQKRIKNDQVVAIQRLA